MPWAAAAAAAASLAGSQMQADAAKDAASEQTRATQSGIDTQNRQFETTRADTLPYRNLGKGSINRLGELLGTQQDMRGPGAPVPKGAMDVTEWAKQQGYNLPTGRDWFEFELNNLYRGGYQKYLDDFRAANPETASPDAGFLNRRFTMADLEADPVYQKQFQFGLDEGEKAVRRMFGAKGLSRSGAAVKAASRFATDYTGQKAGESQQRFVADQANLFNRHATAAGLGNAATVTAANSGSNSANSIADMIVGGGNARGASAIARGNAYSGAFNNIGNNVMGQYYVDRLTQPSTNRSFSTGTVTTPTNYAEYGLTA